jgi:hypothetical protein
MDESRRPVKAGFGVLGPRAELEGAGKGKAAPLLAPVRPVAPERGRNESGAGRADELSGSAALKSGRRHPYQPMPSTTLGDVSATVSLEKQPATARRTATARKNPARTNVLHGRKLRGSAQAP